MRLRPASLPVLLLLLAAAVATPARPQTFEGSSQVTAVEVPVNVLNRDGQPIRGLTADDFEVYDGGDRQKVTSFEVIDLKATQPEAVAPAGTAPPEPPDLRPAARRHFLLLFDLSYSTPASILKARTAARDFVLHSLQPTDLAAVATYSLQSGPKLIVTFTPDRAQLARAVDTLGYHQSFDERTAAETLHFLVEPPDTALLSETAGVSESPLRAQHDQVLLEYLQSVALAAERQERDFEMGRIDSYSRSLGQVARTLGAVPGRKQVLFFSEGFDSRLLLGRDTTDKESQEDNDRVLFGQSYYVDNDQRYGNTSVQDKLSRMLDAFRRADCVIQAVDIGGLRAGADLQARPSGEGTLFYMAHETGGELFKDANNLRDPLNQVLEQTSVTYLLTFERSDLKPDGSYHRLRVKAKLPPGARLTHRAGYYAPRPFKELDPLEKSLLAADQIASAAPRRDLAVDVLAVPFRATAGQAYVPVIIEAGGGSLLAGMTGKDKKLNVEIYAYVSDDKGRMLDFFNRRMGLDLDKGKGRQAILEAGLKYYGHFDLEPGTYHVRVLVRNADTGRTGVETVPVTVPAYDKSQPVLLPPFFMEERQKWLLVREQTGGDGRGSVVYPFTVDGEPYVPAARPVLQGEKAARLCLVVYNLGKGAPAVKGEVLTADGKPAPVGKLSGVERTATGIQGLDKLVATFNPEGLNAGQYVLRVAVTDPATGYKQTNSLPFQVVR